ncbi:DUF3696 domain-containing protein [Deinococcus taklimakanensis]|uniref:DUF3696 domain-containing protein n=1 Tax=Deinococcus taklimakanensis TaxID=536443 RepID=A0ABW5P271_9DEIO
MINKIYLKNFKCFIDESFGLAELNILCGLNSGGKSTLIQSLLLIAQSRQFLPSIRRLNLKGDYYDFGTARDVLNNFSEEDVIEISMSDEHGDYSIVADYNSSNNTFRIPFERAEGSYVAPKRNAARFKLKYISANRTGPVTTQNNSETLNVTPYGDNVIDIIAKNLDTSIPKTLCHPRASSEKLEDQLSAWLGEISPGVEISVDTFRDLGVSAARFSTKTGELSTESHRPTNVGFGLFYILPILVTVLTSRPGDLLIIENPEAHLHPRGQAAIGRLICLAAFGGRQVIVETHSDHVVNALRLLIKEGTLSPESTNLLYFESTSESLYIKRSVVKVEINRSGKILNWPDSFMDQWDNDSMRLI